MAVGEGQPRFAMEEAQALAFQHFGVRGSASEMPSERDQNFLLETSRGEFYVLKIANAAEREAVLDVIEEEGLQGNALEVGTYMKKRLEPLIERHPLIGDVRGSGLFLGVELVLDHQTLEPAPDHATYIIERMKEGGILLSIDGPLHNVIKIKPPMVFSIADAEFLLRTLEDVLEEDVLRLD
jgi:4-aminobutyrate aminotransferase-like enzyme